MTSQHDKASRLQFGLRDLFFLITVVAVAIGWLLDHGRLINRVIRLEYELEGAKLDLELERQPEPTGWQPAIDELEKPSSSAHLSGS